MSDYMSNSCVLYVASQTINGDGDYTSHVMPGNSEFTLHSCRVGWRSTASRVKKRCFSIRKAALLWPKSAASLRRESAAADNQ